jgi:histidinol-phosphate aminotransferase
MIHGGAKWIDGKPSEINDFSVNLNPLGTPSFLLDLITEAMHYKVYQYYPDNYDKLKEVIAEIYDVNPQYIGVFNGATEAIKLLRNEYSVPEPNFSEYPRGSVYFATENEKEFIYHILGKKVLFSNPNNPTGSVISLKEIVNALNSGKDLVIDESFSDISIMDSAKKLVEDFENLLIISTFTKSFSVPGLRLGFTIGKNSRLLESRAIPWRVNSIAYYVFSNIIPKEVRLFFNESRDYVKRLLSEISNSVKFDFNYKMYNSYAPYLLFRFPFDVGVLNNYLIKKGFMVRDARNFIGLNSYYARMSIKRDFKTLIRCINEFYSSNQSILKFSV